MEQNRTFEKKLAVFEQALLGFRLLLDADLSGLSPVICDGVKNGQIQKFEYCSELLWKTIRTYLVEVEGLEPKWPKPSVKDFYSAGHINESTYQSLIEALDSRNLMSHLYKPEVFNQIYSNLSAFLKAFESTLEALKTPIK